MLPKILEKKRTTNGNDLGIVVLHPYFEAILLREISDRDPFPDRFYEADSLGQQIHYVGTQTLKCLKSLIHYR
jgi:hypothetical protein